MDEHGFYAMADGAAYRALSIEGADPTDCLKPSINSDGDIVYVLGVIRPELSQDVSASIEYEDSCSERVHFEPMKSGRATGPAYKLGQIGEAPLVTCRSFDPTEANRGFLLLTIQRNSAGVNAFGSTFGGRSR